MGLLIYLELPQSLQQTINYKKEQKQFKNSLLRY